MKNDVHMKAGLGKQQTDLRGHKMQRLPIGPERKAAVMIPLIRIKGEWNLLFEVRAKNIVQGGEICFPGGRVEEGEEAEDAAVRETMEELQISRSQIDVICPMFQLTGPGGTEIFSYLGMLGMAAGDDSKYDRENHNTSSGEGSKELSSLLQRGFSNDEVAEVFSMPLVWFREHLPEAYKAEMVTEPGPDFPFEILPEGENYRFRPVPRTFYFYKTEYGPLWGMTAQIVHAAIPLLNHFI